MKPDLSGIRLLNELRELRIFQNPERCATAKFGGIFPGVNKLTATHTHFLCPGCQYQNSAELTNPVAERLASLLPQV